MTSQADRPLVSFMIATRNRVSELRKTLAACSAQTWPATEVLVVDDASTDGTAEMVRGEFPEVNFVRNEQNRGSIGSRNDILRRARGKYIICLDDDSRFVESDALERVVARFEAEPDLGIISFQAIGPERPGSLTPEGRWGGEWHCSSFAACAAAIRAEILAHTGLLEEWFFHAYEEPDLCIRAWDAGYRVLQWNDIVVYHEFSGVNRNEQRTHRRHARNEACSTLMRCPWHLLVPLLMIRLLRQFRYAVSRGWGLQELRVWAETALRVPRALVRRRAVGTGAMKIAIASNRCQIVAARDVWAIRGMPWRTILLGTQNSPAGAAK